VRKLKSKTTMPHYVEIMACPTGCLNGGAQVRPAELENNQSRDLSLKLENDYHQLPEVQEMTSAHNILKDLNQNESLKNRILYTEFHALGKQNILGIKW